jgi:MFS transporter, SP family, arabinose:H+ symporter
MKPALVKHTMVAALGGLLFGFDTAVISGTTSSLTETYQLSPGLLGITVASALWGTVLGERWGRRDSPRIMAVLGTALCLAGVSALFFTGAHQNLLVWLLIGFIAFFAFSQGAVIWVYLAEVFPNHVRAKGQSLGSFSHWFMNALISGVFPMMAASSGGHPFAFFSAMMVLELFVVFAVYPETKALSLEEMPSKLGIR